MLVDSCRWPSARLHPPLFLLTLYPHSRRLTDVILPFAQLCAGHAFVRGLPSCPLFRSLLTSTWTSQGRIDNGLLRPESGSTWMTMSDGEAAIAFMNILLGCLVGTCCFQLHFFFGCKRIVRAETASFHGGITLASFLLLDCVARWTKRANPPSSIRQQLRYVLLAFCAASAYFCNSTVPDTRIYLCVCSTLPSPSSCSSWFSPSGDRSKSRGTRLLHTYTRCRRKVRSGIS